MKTAKDFIAWIFADAQRTFYLFGVTALSGSGMILTILYLQQAP